MTWLQLTPSTYARLLIGCLIYGSGLRLFEALSLRIKDIEFEHRALVVRDGKGAKDRVVTLADSLEMPLPRHLEDRRTIYDQNIVAVSYNAVLNTSHR